MHDKNGELLAADDLVFVQCRVKDVSASEEYCNVTLETREAMFPSENKTIIVLNARQVEKTLQVRSGLPSDLRNQAVQHPPVSAEREEALKFRESFSLSEHLKTLDTPAAAEAAPLEQASSKAPAEQCAVEPVSDPILNPVSDAPAPLPSEDVSTASTIDSSAVPVTEPVIIAPAPASEPTPEPVKETVDAN